MASKSTRELKREIDELTDVVRLKRKIARLLDKWEPRLGTHLHDWGVRKMKSYWGSTNKQTRHIWFNIDLLKLPPAYLEYAVVHELVHLLTDGHDAKFYALMDQHLPGWRRKQAQIEEPLRQYS